MPQSPVARPALSACFYVNTMAAHWPSLWGPIIPGAAPACFLKARRFCRRPVCKERDVALLLLGRCTSYRGCRTHSILQTHAVLACGRTWWVKHTDCFALALFGDADLPQTCIAGSNQQCSDISNALSSIGRDSPRTLGSITDRGGNGSHYVRTVSTRPATVESLRERM
jgi:hypothetical protein